MAAVGIPLLRLARPGWSGRQDASTWHWVDSVEAAGLLAMELGHRAFLTTGRQTLAAYEPMTGRYALVRVVEPPTDRSARLGADHRPRAVRGWTGS